VQTSQLSTLEGFFWDFPAPYISDSDKLLVKETYCSSLLHQMNFGSVTELTINQYKGCSHGCIYCYAPSLIHDDRSWGGFVDAKVNAHKILDRELARFKKQVVFVSSASDPYQPVEAKFKITRKVLEVLVKHKFPVLLLTRSPLVLRDLDLLRRLDWVRVGFSISSVPTKFYEPGVPSVEKRIEALSKLHDAGIKTWVSMAPIIPTQILLNVDSLFSRLREARVSSVTMGLLRFNGYEKSKEMFEERSGKKHNEVMEGGRSIYDDLKEKAKAFGLDTSGSSLSWEDKNEESVSLESFSA
jgi:DNA repair photolyase